MGVDRCALFGSVVGDACTLRDASANLPRFARVSCVPSLKVSGQAAFLVVNSSKTLLDQYEYRTIYRGSSDHAVD